jgi:hypothetical protein
MANLPINNSELNSLLFQDVDADIKELCIEQVSLDHNSLELSASSHCRSLSRALNDLHHVVVLMLLSLGKYFSQLLYVLVPSC